MELEVNDPTPPTQAIGAWLYAACDNPWYSLDTERSGKWLVFLSDESIDRYWLLIRLSLAMFRLGRVAKVSTATSKQENYVIVVYTYDYADKADVMRIRRELYDIGIRYPIPYKSNEQTRRGFYGASMSDRVRKGPFVPIYRV